MGPILFAPTSMLDTCICVYVAPSVRKCSPYICLYYIHQHAHDELAYAQHMHSMQCLSMSDVALLHARRCPCCLHCLQLML